MWVEFVLIGAMAGFAAGYLGIGGGLVLVPALTWIFNREPETALMAVHMAVATSLATMLVTSLSSIIAHHRRQAVRWITVRKLVPGLLTGAVAGAIIADQLSSPSLGRVFAVYAVMAGLQLLFSRQQEFERPLPGPAGIATTGTLIGAISSMVGIGGGSMTVPWLLWHGIRAQNAVATAAACGYPIAVAGTVSFVLLGRAGTETAGGLGYVQANALVSIALVSVLFAPVGAWLVHRSPPRLVRKLFGAFLLVLAIRMWL
jgi:uncharacterized membrane protein YfcA